MSEYFPSSLSYDAVCDLLDDSKEQWWLPAAQFICQKHEISIDSIKRIEEGGNLLLLINDKLILKCVPPHWDNQGKAEIEAFRLLQNKLPSQTPDVMQHGELNGWVYLFQNLLPGSSLADYWGEMSFANKQKIVKQIAEIINAMHGIKLTESSSLRLDWKAYYQELSEDCIPRHQRKGLPKSLVSQINEYLESTGQNTYEVLDDLKESEGDLFIHMDLHPWNIMVEEQAGDYSVSGILDFGDAVVGRSKLLELATPLLFLCQGNPELCKTLLENYKFLPEVDRSALKQKLMAVSLLRPACDFNFVLSQVPQTGPRENWSQIADQLFPI